MEGLSMESKIMLAVQIGTMLVSIGAIYGIFKGKLDNITNAMEHLKELLDLERKERKESFERLEKKQDKYNNLQERLARVEANDRVRASS